MNDLIWVGNTLYPRSMIIGSVAAVFLAPFVIGACLMYVKRKITNKRWL